jgi:hypothetical protein
MGQFIKNQDQNRPVSLTFADDDDEFKYCWFNIFVKLQDDTKFKFWMGVAKIPARKCIWLKSVWVLIQDNPRA